MFSLCRMLTVVGCYFLVLCFFMWLLVRKISHKPVDLQGKVVLVTGASSGLGRACCFAFCRHKCHLILCSRRVDELEKLREELASFSADQCRFKLDVQILPLDVTELEKIGPALDSALRALNDRIDILVNNAGVSFRGRFEETSVSVFERMMRVNFMGQVALTKAVLPHMLEAGGGHIVGVGSVQGKISQPGRAPYAASKHACQAFYDSLRAELSHRNIFVSVINPGYIRTNLSVNAVTVNNTRPDGEVVSTYVLGDGATYGRMDATTSSGYDPDDVANMIVEMVAERRAECLMAPFHHKLVVWLRNIFPFVYFWIMAKRAART